MEREIHAGHRARLKERFCKGEMDAFAPHEALELLLTYAIPRRDTNALAHALIERFGSLHAVLEAPVEELTAVDGIGEHAALLMRLMLPLMRLYDQDKQVKRPSMDTFSQVEDHCRTLFKGVTVERFYVLCFDARLKLIASQMIAEGTLNEVAIYPRRVVSAVLRHNAAGTVLCHNHPGGSPLPSDEDVALTEQIEALVTGVGVRLYDHILIAGDRCFSFFANGLIGQSGTQPLENRPYSAEKPRLRKPKKRTEGKDETKI